MHQLQTKDVQTHYDIEIKKRYKNNYEQNRWFLNGRTRMDYHMTHRFISYHIKNIAFNTCFELGPGPGTWTKLLYRQKPRAKFHLLDISKEMRKQFPSEMQDKENIEYSVGDFLEYDVKENFYDLFFSSRAIEYLPDKEKAVKKIASLLKPGGICMVITKNPSLFTLRKGKVSNLHSSQIEAQDLRTLFRENGFEHIQLFPVVVRLSIIDRFTLWISKRLFTYTYKNNIEKTPFYAESYSIICRKKL